MDMMASDWLEDGWQQRTKQKLAFAGCMAALFSLRNDPLKGVSRLRDFLTKLAGYGGGAVIFNGIQETCRAARGRHDFLNSTFSGAVTGALVVGHFQGAKYRLLGAVTWGSLSGAFHLANQGLTPRYYLEEYLIHEGLLSPEALRYRSKAQLNASPGGTALDPLGLSRVGVLSEVKVIRDRELRLINDNAASREVPVAAASSASDHHPVGAVAAGRHVNHIPDDDPGYQAWLRAAGFQSDTLLVAVGHEQQQQPEEHQCLEAAPGSALQSRVEWQEGSGGGEGRAEAGDGGGDSGAMPDNPDAAVTAAVTVGSRSNWSTWLQPWKW